MGKVREWEAGACGCGRRRVRAGTGSPCGRRRLYACTNTSTRDVALFIIFPRDKLHPDYDYRTKIIILYSR